MKQEIIKIDGKHCNHCVNAVKTALINAGAKTANVSLEEKNATVTFEDNVELSCLENAIEEIGFDVVK